MIKGAGNSPFVLVYGSVATAAAVAVIAAEQIAQRSVLPHTVNERYEYGGTASGKDAFKPVTAATCGNE